MSDDATGIDFPLSSTVFPSDAASVKPCNSILDTALRLKLIRDAFGFSQRELAKRAGVTNSSISMIEQGQVSPSIQSLTRILSAFPVTLTDFFGFQFHINPPVESYIQPNHQQLDACIQHLCAGQFTAFSLLATDLCGVVLDGSLQLTLLNESRVLTQGDSFYIPHNQLFRWINISGSEASLFRCSFFAHKT